MLADSWYALLNNCSDREEIATEWQASLEDPGKRQIWVRHRTTDLLVSLIIYYMCRSALRPGRGAGGSRGFSLSFPKSQPCVRGTSRAVPGSSRPQKGRTCCAHSVLTHSACPAKLFCLGCIRCITQEHSPCAGKNREKKLWEP